MCIRNLLEFLWYWFELNLISSWCHRVFRCASMSYECVQKQIEIASISAWYCFRLPQQWDPWTLRPWDSDILKTWHCETLRLFYIETLMSRHLETLRLETLGSWDLGTLRPWNLDTLTSLDPQTLRPCDHMILRPWGRKTLRPKTKRPWNFQVMSNVPREDVKYYFADFVPNWGTPPPLYGQNFRQKRS